MLGGQSDHSNEFPGLWSSRKHKSEIHKLYTLIMEFTINLSCFEKKNGTLMTLNLLSNHCQYFYQWYRVNEWKSHVQHFCARLRPSNRSSTYLLWKVYCINCSFWILASSLENIWWWPLSIIGYWIRWTPWSDLVWSAYLHLENRVVHAWKNRKPLRLCSWGSLNLMYFFFLIRLFLFCRFLF